MEFDLSEITAPFRMQPGLSKMAPDARHTRLLEPDSTLFHEKLSVLCTHPDQALLQVAQFDTRPALHVLAQQLAVEWPQACTFADDILNLPTLGLQLNLQSLDVQVTAQCVVSDCVHALSHPQRVWAALSLFLQDDLAVLDGTSTQLKMLAVCVPSHWSPEEKLACHWRLYMRRWPTTPCYCKPRNRSQNWSRHPALRVGNALYGHCSPAGNTTVTPNVRSQDIGLTRQKHWASSSGSG